MADNYLERRMEAYRAQPAAQPRRAATLERSADQEPQRARLRRPVRRAGGPARSIVSVCTKIPSARNQQVLRFRLVLADEAPGASARPHGRCAARTASAAGGHGTQRLHRRLFDGARRPGSTSIWASPCRACCSGPSRSGSTGLYRRVRPRCDSDEAAAALRTAADPRRREERRTDRAGRDRRRRRSALLSFGGRPLCPQDSGRGADYRFGFGGNRR